ncbi:MAG: D-sedoheptulose 7-phosphate isomerase [Bacteroidia bacterium]|nr:D-sedoheptulose 7-phosphate isomerase [Bacteroidia bacterium]
MSDIKSIIQESISVKEKLLSDEQLLNTVESIADAIVTCLRNGGKVLFCGNGGSAADAQHLAAELSGRFYVDRDPLFAEALHVNTSYLTAVANDYSYDQIYSRAVKGKGRKGDILIGISTSGNSSNIIKAMDVARELNMINVGLTGESGGKMKDLCDHLVNVPSSDTPRIQECHIVIGHIICQLVEENYFKLEKS